MSFIQDIIAPGSRQQGDAAQTASEAQKAISDKLLSFVDQLQGYVKNADEQGLFDQDKAAERFRRSFDRMHGQDLEQTTAALRHAGMRPGDSEMDYRFNKEKMRLDQDRLNGEEDARHKAFQERMSAYLGTVAPISQAAASASAAGQLGTAAEEARMNGMNTVYDRVGRLYTGLSGMMGGRRKSSPIDYNNIDFGPDPNYA